MLLSIGLLNAGLVSIPIKRVPLPLIIFIQRNLALMTQEMLSRVLGSKFGTGNPQL